MRQWYRSALTTYEGENKVRLLASVPTRKNVDYNWQFNGKTYKVADTTVRINRPGSFKYALEVSASDGCYAYNDGIITTPNFTYAVIAPYTDSLCSGDTLKLKPLILQGPGNPSIRWNGKSLGIDLEQIIFGDTMVIMEANFGKDYSTFDTAYVSVRMRPTFQISAHSTHCVGNRLNVSFLSSDTTVKAVDWYLPVDTLAGYDVITVEGEPLIEARSIAENDCPLQDTLQIQFDKFFSLKQRAYQVCPKTEATLTAGIDSSMKIKWRLPDGTILGEKDPLLLRADSSVTVYSEVSFQDDSTSCQWLDSITVNLRQRLLPYQKFIPELCENADPILLKDTQYISVLGGEWLDQEEEDRIYDSVYFDPSNAFLGKNELVYRVKHPLSNCITEIPFAVVTNEVPDIAKNIDTLELCRGAEPYLLSSTQLMIPSTGIWSGPGIELQGESYYFYSALGEALGTNVLNYHYTDDNGCSAYDSILLILSLQTNMEASARNGVAPLTIEFFDDRTNSVCEVNSWFWDFGDAFAEPCTSRTQSTEAELYCQYSTVQRPSHRFIKSGIYHIKLVVADTSTGVTDTVEKEGFIVLLSSSIEENGEPSQLWPNPFSSQLFFSPAIADQIANVSIYDLWGRERFNYRFDGRNYMAIDGLESGVYLVVFRDSNGRILYKERIQCVYTD